MPTGGIDGGTAAGAPPPTGGTAPKACVALDAGAEPPDGAPPKSWVDFSAERVACPEPPVTAGVDREGGGAPCGAAMKT
ncbi:hypothetical protein [Myxococcus sp. Y35]|uniref:hypothetical protein n=1 Tax=Pseudomyxococcus flavus TaxID=3115648 RepID=UPI003CF5C198